MPPLTDADFEKMEKETMDLQQEMKSNNITLATAPVAYFEQLQKLSMEQLPEREDRDKYREWERRRWQEKHAPKPAKPVGHYIETIASTDFADDEAVQKLVWLLNAVSHPFIGIGTYKKYKYRLAPSAIHMVADEARVDWRTGESFAAECVLGVEIVDGGITYQEGAHRQDDPSSEHFSSSSDNTTSPTGNDDTGFAFMQLGKVYSIAT